MKRLARGALTLAALTLLPAVAVAATVKGKVTNTRGLMNAVWNEAKDPAKKRFTFREHVSTVPPDARVLRGHIAKELCLAVLSDAGGAKPSAPMRVVIEGGRTNVVTLVVAPGQEIRFENHDPTPHAIYEVNGKLSKGVINPEASRAWTPPGPGKYELRDELSPGLRSWIVVEPKLVKAVFPNRRGDFNVELDPASYKVQAYYAGEPVGEVMPFDVRLGLPEQTLPNPVKAGPDKPADGKPGEAKPATNAPAGAPATPATGG
jgi:hypothetical protein